MEQRTCSISVLPAYAAQERLGIRPLIWPDLPDTPVGCAPSPTGRYAQAVLVDAPASYYRLGDLSRDPNSGVGSDSSGHCCNGAFAPGVVNQPDAAIAADTDAAAHQPASGVAALAASVSALPTGDAPRTMEAWFRTTDAETYRSIMGYGGGFLSLTAYGPDRLFVSEYGNNSHSVVAPYSFRDGRWHHVVVTLDGTTAVFYLDGQTLGSTEMTMNTPAGEGNLQVGGFVGDVDEAAVYPTALSAERVNTHWTGARG